MAINYNSIPETDWARLAAYIDGDGCLFIDFKRVSKTGAGNVTNTSRAAILVANTDFRLPLWLSKTFGGDVLTRRSKSLAHRERPEYYTWSAGHKALPEILPRIIPWLVIKRDQAENLLAFRYTLDGRRGRYYRTSAKILDIREALWKRSHELKKPQQRDDITA